MMKSKVLMTLGFSLLPWTLAIGQPLYCPQHSGYIDIGMSVDQVISACGQPISKQPSNKPVTQRIPVQQLIYTALNTGSIYPGLNSAFYDQWSLPSGTTGVSLEVDVTNQKVSAVRINGSSTNAMSLCGGTPVQVGDNVNKVYMACGSPGMVNNTFINQSVPSNTKPEVWIYQVDQYQSPISLTFVNGKLQSIN
jgi:hypothetical protein